MNTSDPPPIHSRTLRVVFGVAATVDAVSLALLASNWLRSGSVQWGLAATVSGLLILMLTGAIAIPHGLLRNTCSAIGVGLVVIGAAIVFYA